MKKRLFYKYISIFLILTYIGTLSAQAAPINTASTATILAAPKSSLNDIIANPHLLAVPWQSASLKEIYQAKAPSLRGARSSNEAISSNKLIILIEDAHANLSGQKNLANSIDSLMKNYGISTVLVEGSSTDVTLSHAKNQMPKKNLIKAAKQLLYYGIISGEEHLNLTTDHNMQLLGIEDQQLYNQNLNIYHNVTQVRTQALNYIHQIQNSLIRLKNKTYPKELLNYEQDHTSLRGAERRGNLPAKLENLAHISKPETINQYLELQKLLQLQELEENINFTQANQDQIKLFDLLTSKGHSKEVKDFMTTSRTAANSQIAQYNHLLTILNFAETNSINLAFYSELMKYKAYLYEFSKLNMNQILEQVNDLENDVYQQLLISNDAQKIRSIDRYLSLLDKAYKIQMSHQEFDIFHTNQSDFEIKSILAFMNLKLAELDYFEDIIPLQETITQSLPQISQFYDVVNQRDEAFKQNAIDIMDSNDEDVAVLIAGGYHTQHLTELMRQGNLNYIVLTPHITAQTDHNQYERLLFANSNLDSKKFKTANTIKQSGSRINAQQRLQTIVRAGARLSQDSRQLVEVMSYNKSGPRMAGPQNQIDEQVERVLEETKWTSEEWRARNDQLEHIDLQSDVTWEEKKAISKRYGNGNRFEGITSQQKHADLHNGVLALALNLNHAGFNEWGEVASFTNTLKDSIVGIQGIGDGADVLRFLLHFPKIKELHLFDVNRDLLTSLDFHLDRLQKITDEPIQVKIIGHSRNSMELPDDLTGYFDVMYDASTFVSGYQSFPQMNQINAEILRVLKNGGVHISGGSSDLRSYAHPSNSDYVIQRLPRPEIITNHWTERALNDFTIRLKKPSRMAKKKIVDKKNYVVKSDSDYQPTRMTEFESLDDLRKSFEAFAQKVVEYAADIEITLHAQKYPNNETDFPRTEAEEGLTYKQQAELMWDEVLSQVAANNDDEALAAFDIWKDYEFSTAYADLIFDPRSGKTGLVFGNDYQPHREHYLYQMQHEGFIVKSAISTNFLSYQGKILAFGDKFEETQTSIQRGLLESKEILISGDKKLYEIDFLTHLDHLSSPISIREQMDPGQISALVSEQNIYFGNSEQQTQNLQSIPIVSFGDSTILRTDRIAKRVQLVRDWLWDSDSDLLSNFDDRDDETVFRPETTLDLESLELEEFQITIDDYATVTMRDNEYDFFQVVLDLDILQRQKFDNAFESQTEEGDYVIIGDRNGPTHLIKITSVPRDDLEASMLSPFYERIMSQMPRSDDPFDYVRFVEALGISDKYSKRQISPEDLITKVLPMYYKPDLAILNFVRSRGNYKIAHVQSKKDSNKEAKTSNYTVQVYFDASEQFGSTRPPSRMAKKKTAAKKKATKKKAATKKPVKKKAVKKKAVKKKAPSDAIKKSAVKKTKSVQTGIPKDEVRANELLSVITRADNVIGGPLSSNANEYMFRIILGGKEHFVTYKTNDLKNFTDIEWKIPSKSIIKEFDQGIWRIIHERLMRRTIYLRFKTQFEKRMLEQSGLLLKDPGRSIEAWGTEKKSIYNVGQLAKSNFRVIGRADFPGTYQAYLVEVFWQESLEITPGYYSILVPQLSGSSEPSDLSKPFLMRKWDGLNITPTNKIGLIKVKSKAKAKDERDSLLGMLHLNSAANDWISDLGSLSDEERVDLLKRGLAYSRKFSMRYRLGGYRKPSLIQYTFAIPNKDDLMQNFELWVRHKGEVDNNEVIKAVLTSGAQSTTIFDGSVSAGGSLSEYFSNGGEFAEFVASKQNSEPQAFGGNGMARGTLNEHIGMLLYRQESVSTDRVWFEKGPKTPKATNNFRITSYSTKTIDTELGALTSWDPFIVYQMNVAVFKKTSDIIGVHAKLFPNLLTPAELAKPAVSITNDNGLQFLLTYPTMDRLQANLINPIGQSIVSRMAANTWNPSAVQEESMVTWLTALEQGLVQHEDNLFLRIKHAGVIRDAGETRTSWQNAINHIQNRINTMIVLIREKNLISLNSGDKFIELRYYIEELDAQIRDLMQGINRGFFKELNPGDTFVLNGLATVSPSIRSDIVGPLSLIRTKYIRPLLNLVPELEEPESPTPDELSTESRMTKRAELMDKGFDDNQHNVLNLNLPQSLPMLLVEPSRLAVARLAVAHKESGDGVYVIGQSKNTVAYSQLEFGADDVGARLADGSLLKLDIDELVSVGPAHDLFMRRGLLSTARTLGEGVLSIREEAYQVLDWISSITSGKALLLNVAIESLSQHEDFEYITNFFEGLRGQRADIQIEPSAFEGRQPIYVDGAVGIDHRVMTLFGAETALSLSLEDLGELADQTGYFAIKDIAKLAKEEVIRLILVSALFKAHNSPEEAFDMLVQTQLGRNVFGRSVKRQSVSTMYDISTSGIGESRITALRHIAQKYPIIKLLQQALTRAFRMAKAITTSA
ncbi:MAG: hypothetical protein ACI9CF_001316 [Candidatus Omnitrophota bacterium]|jgi:hypothetical protein